MDLIFWTGPGWYYPAQRLSPDGDWFTVWTYGTVGQSDRQPGALEGMGTPCYFESVPDDVEIAGINFEKVRRRVRDALNKTADEKLILKAAELFGVKL